MNCIFRKGLIHAFRQKCNFSLSLFSVKVRLEIMFNNVLERKETFFGIKIPSFKVLKYYIFSKGLTHAFNQRCNFSLSLFSVKI